MAAHHKTPTPLSANLSLTEYIERLNFPELISPVRLAELLDLDRRRVYELVKSGDLVAVRVGVRGIRIFRQSLLNWLRAGGSGGRNEDE